MAPSVSKIPELASRIYELLEPLSEDERAKVISGVRGMLGSVLQDSGDLNHSKGAAPHVHFADDPWALGPRASSWAKRHQISHEDLSNVFHVEGDRVEVIGRLPGKTKREQSINAYLLSGIRGLLANDDTSFSEQDAVSLCQREGCYDRPNHSVTRTALRNRVSGSKDKGYTLTHPGQDEAAKVVKFIARPEGG